MCWFLENHCSLSPSPSFSFSFSLFSLCSLSFSLSLPLNIKSAQNDYLLGFLMVQPYEKEKNSFSRVISFIPEYIKNFKKILQIQNCQCTSET